HGGDLLRRGHADRLDPPPGRQGAAEPHVRARGHDLLDPPPASRPGAALDAAAILSVTFLLEFVQFLRVRKKYWLIPLLLMMALFGGLIVLSQGSAIAPFVYTLF